MSIKPLKMRKKTEKPSPELLQLIKIANFAPLKPKPLPTSKEIDQNPVKAFEEITRITKKYPTLFEYVFNENEETEFMVDGKPNPLQQLHRYDNVLTIQKILIDIATTSTVFSNKFGMKRFEKMSFEGNTEILFPIDYRIENGKLHFVLTDITKTLEGIDARRLKWCKECRSIFWAYRLNARYCSDKCGNLFRVKESQRKKAENEKLEKEKRQKFLNQNFGKK